MFIRYFLPDYRFNNIYEITPAFLAGIGIRAVICDIDNTLVPYEEPIPTPKVSSWLEKLHAADIKVAFVSNNNAERVDKFNQKLGYFAAADSGKPLARMIFAAMQHMDSKQNHTAVVGDQIFTDILAAKRAGAAAILVNPIKDKNTLFFRFKRALEKPFLGAYERRVRRGK